MMGQLLKSIICFTVLPNKFLACVGLARLWLLVSAGKVLMWQTSWLQWPCIELSKSLYWKSHYQYTIQTILMTSNHKIVSNLKVWNSRSNQHHLLVWSEQPGLNRCVCRPTLSLGFNELWWQWALKWVSFCCRIYAHHKGKTTDTSLLRKSLLHC